MLNEMKWDVLFVCKQHDTPSPNPMAGWGKSTHLIGLRSAQRLKRNNP